MTPGQARANERQNVRRSADKLAVTLAAYFPEGARRVILRYDTGNAPAPEYGPPRERAAQVAFDARRVYRVLWAAGAVFVIVPPPTLDAVTYIVPRTGPNERDIAAAWEWGAVDVQQLPSSTNWGELARELLAPHLAAGCNLIPNTRMWSRNRVKPATEETTYCP